MRFNNSTSFLAQETDLGIVSINVVKRSFIYVSLLCKVCVYCNKSVRYTGYIQSKSRTICVPPLPLHLSLSLIQTHEAIYAGYTIRKKDKEQGVQERQQLDYMIDCIFFPNRLSIFRVCFKTPVVVCLWQDNLHFTVNPR